MATAGAAPSLPFDLGDEPAPEGFHQLFPTEKVEVFGKVEEEVFQLALLARLCSREVDALFGDNRMPTHLLSFYAMNISYEESAFRNWDVPLATTEALDALMVRMLKGLLLRQLRERLGVHVRRTAAPASLNFLAAALANRIANDGKGIRGFYQKDYRIPRWQFATGPAPSCEKLLTVVPPPAARILYRLYLVHCDVLLSCLESHCGRQMKTFLGAWWKLECQEKLPTQEALAQVLGISREKLQEWYVQNAVAQARQGVHTEAAEAIAGQLDKVLTVSVVELGDAQPVRMVHIEELPKLLKNRRPDVAALTDVQMSLLRLKLASTPIFHTAIDYFSAAVSALAHSDLKLFQRRYGAAREELEKALALQRKVTQLMDEAERELSSLDAVRAATLDELMRHRARLREPMDCAVGFPENP